MSEDGSAPFHIVNAITGLHIGPFSTAHDAALAKYIGTEGWPTGEIMDKETFNTHLENK